jgi:hypothetical protein
MDTTLLASHVTAAMALAVLLGNVRRRPVTAELSAPRQHPPRRGLELGGIGHLPGRRVDAPAGIAGQDQIAVADLDHRAVQLVARVVDPASAGSRCTISGHAAVSGWHVRSRSWPFAKHAS